LVLVAGPFGIRFSGYVEVVGIYPGEKRIGPFDIFESLKDVPPAQRKFVNVFRRSEDIPAVVDQILAVGGVEVLWLQLGIANTEAESRAERAGIKVVSNRCWLVDYNNCQP
jgi:predicted CoA-binding protein